MCKTYSVIKESKEAGIPQAGVTPTEETPSVFFHPRHSHEVLIQVLKKGIFDSTGRISDEILEKTGKDSLNKTWP